VWYPSAVSDPSPFADHIVAVLRQIGFPYRRNGEGNFEVEVGTVDERVQIVTIDAHGKSIEGVKICRMYSIAYQCDDLVSEGIANALLSCNSTTVFGAFGIQQASNGHRFVAYIANVPVGISADFMRGAMLEAVDKADNIEKNMSGVDRF